MRHYMGLDVGGTKTHCLIADESGEAKGFGRGGTGNYEYHGVEAAAVENFKAVVTALESAGLPLGAISAIGMGVAGADLPEDFVMLEREIYTPLFGGIPRVFKNDSMAGLRGGSRGPHGIVIACGTGAVCAGRNASGRETRVGGLGPEFGDKCTGTSIGEEGLRTVWRARDGIVPPTLLTDKFLAQSGCGDIEELFLNLYRRQMTVAQLGPMAKLVFDAAVDGDPAACDILDCGGRYLGAMVNAVARRLEMTREEFEVVKVGGVFNGASPILVEAMRATVWGLCPGAVLVRPAFEPVVGALLMAFELECPVTEALYSRLSGSLLELEDRYQVNFKAGDA